MKTNRSLRKTAIIRFCGFTLVLSSFYALLAVLIAFIVEDEVINKLLNVEIDHVKIHYAENGNLPEPSLPFIQYFPTILAMQESLPVDAKSLTDAGEFFVPGDSHYHARRVQLNSNTEHEQPQSIYLIAEVGALLAVSKLSTNIIILIVSICLLGILLAIWQAYALANYTLKPLSELAVSVKHYNDKQFGEPQLPTTENEIEYVTQVVSSAFENLRDALIRESTFTSDVSHELRTPLTVFQNSLTLIEQRGWVNADKQKLSLAAQSMQMTIDTLLMLARGDSISRQNILLRPILEHVILAYYDELQSADVSVDIVVDDNAKVSANETIVELIVKSTLYNVIQHAAPCDLLVSFSGAQLTVENTMRSNTSPTISPQMTDDNGKGLTSSPHTTQNHGLGNKLVTRLAKRVEWTVQFEQTPKHYKVILTTANSRT